jgi:hypothetical protein
MQKQEASITRVPVKKVTIQKVKKQAFPALDTFCNHRSSVGWGLVKVLLQSTKTGFK